MMRRGQPRGWVVSRPYHAECSKLFVVGIEIGLLDFVVDSWLI